MPFAILAKSFKNRRFLLVGGSMAMHGLLVCLLLILQAKLVVLEWSDRYPGEYDLDAIRRHESVERRKCEAQPYKTVFTVSPGKHSFKLVCSVRSDRGCSRDEIYKYRLIETRPLDHLENWAAVSKGVMRFKEHPEKNPPICVFEYTLKIEVDPKHVYHSCEKGWLFTENAQNIQPWQPKDVIQGRHVPMCFKTFATTLTMSEARRECAKYNSVLAPIRNSMEEMAFMNAFKIAFPNGLPPTGNVGRGFGWVGMENKCDQPNNLTGCFYWDYDGKMLGEFQLWASPNEPNALSRIGFEWERCPIWSYGKFPYYGYSDWHCECRDELCTQYPIKAITCAKDATPPPHLPTPRRIQYHCDDDSWIFSRRSDYNGVPLCFKGAKAYNEPSYDESKELCAEWGAVLAPMEDQPDMEIFYKAMDRVFPDGDFKGKYVYIGLRNIKKNSTLNDRFIYDWNGLGYWEWIGNMNWFNETLTKAGADPNSGVYPGVPGFENCVIVDLFKKKWRDWYCRCEPGQGCILNHYPTSAIACAKPASQFIY